MSKSATLRLAIDHIAEIEAENVKLKEEVINLRALLEYHQIEVGFIYKDKILFDFFRSLPTRQALLPL